jgi:hypothetical protein
VGVVAPERERSTPPPGAPPPAPPSRRRGPSPLALAALGLVLLMLLFGGSWLRGLLPGIPNPFAAETIDRTAPALLRSIQDLSEYRAATGHFEVIVDIERETRLPDALLGERTLFVAVGNVDATVDFRGLGADAVAVSADGRSATVRLPRARLAPAALDLDQSYVYDRRRGILTGIGELLGGDPDRDRQLYLTAQAKLDEAAAADSGLKERAEENTGLLLESLLRSLGFADVAVRFD